MSERVVLTLRAPLDHSIEADGLVPDRLGLLDESEIAALPVRAGRERRVLGDYFHVSGGRSATCTVVGDVRRLSGLGTGMAGGALVIEGDAGERLAAGMSGGRVEVTGSVGDDAGVAMSGGSLHVRGSAGDRLAANFPGASRGMTGGEVVVEGSAGADVGARMRRGLVFIGGSVGVHSARSIIAGTVIVIGNVGAEPAFASKRGTLVAAGEIVVPVTYRYACTYEPPHVRLALTYLARRHDLAIDPRLVRGPYRRFCGDAGTVGKGEILEWVPG